MKLRFWTALGLAASLLASVGAANAAELVLKGDMRQGALIRGIAEPGARVTFNGETIRVSSDGQFTFGFDRDAAASATLAVVWVDGTTETRDLTVATYDWDVQRIDGLPPSKVSPRTPEQLAKIRKDAALKWEARNRDTDETWFADDFIWPLAGIITGQFGNQRVLNGEPKRPHYGVDIAAPTGTPILAPADGIVSLAEDNLYFEGGTVFIDHGHGVIDIFLHMSEVLVEPGQSVKQGDVIGKVGATGRATGPHLCWRMFWRQTRT